MCPVNIVNIYLSLIMFVLFSAPLLQSPTVYPTNYPGGHVYNPSPSSQQTKRLDRQIPLIRPVYMQELRADPLFDNQGGISIIPLKSAV